MATSGDLGFGDSGHGISNFSLVMSFQWVASHSGLTNISQCFTTIFLKPHLVVDL